MSEELKKYIEELEKEEREIWKEKNEFSKKFTDGKSLTREENKKNIKLTERAKKIKEQLDIVHTINSLEVMKGELARLGKQSVSESEKKDAIIPMLKSYFEEFNKQKIEKFSKEYGISPEDLEKAEENINKLEQEIRSLTYELESAKKRNFNVNEIEKEIAEKEKLLEYYQEFLKSCVDLKQLEEDLKTIMSDTTLTEVEITEIKADIVKLEERNKSLLDLLEIMKLHHKPTHEIEAEIKTNEDIISAGKKEIEKYEEPPKKKLTDEEIKKLEEKKALLEEDIKKLQSGLEVYKSIPTMDSKNAEVLDNLIKQKEEELVEVEKTIKENYTVTKEEAETAKSIKETLKNELEILNNRLKDNNLSKDDEKEIKKEIKDKEDKIEEYEKIISAYESHKKPYLMTEKQKLLSKYNLIIDELKTSQTKELEEKINKDAKKKKPSSNPDDDKDKSLKEKLEELKNKSKEKFNDLKTKTKEKLNFTDKKLSESAKTGIKATVAVVAAVSIIILCAKACSKNSNNGLTSDEPTTSHSDGLLDPTLDASIPEKYQNPSYIQDIKNAYNLTDEEAYDLINRAYKIYQSGFYGEVPLNQIIQVLDAINDQDINRVENAALDQSINAALTEIYNHYAYGKIVEADLNKVNALEYFARDNTELDKILETYQGLLYNLLASQGDAAKTEAARNAILEFLEVFANSRAGFVPEDTTLSTESIAKYPSANITDTFQWGIFWESFCKPMFSAFISQGRINEWICLQENILSAYEQWVKIYLCEDTTLTLGK